MKRAGPGLNVQNHASIPSAIFLLMDGGAKNQADILRRLEVNIAQRVDVFCPRSDSRVWPINAIPHVAQHIAKNSAKRRRPGG